MYVSIELDTFMVQPPTRTNCPSETINVAWWSLFWHIRCTLQEQSTSIQSFNACWLWAGSTSKQTHTPQLCKHPNRFAPVYTTIILCIMACRWARGLVELVTKTVTVSIAGLLIYFIFLLINLITALINCEPRSSISTVSGYGLDDRAIEVRFRAEEKDFSSSLCIQTGSGAHPFSCTMGTEDPFPTHPI
jgi:hypothetical protein